MSPSWHRVYDSIKAEKLALNALCALCYFGCKPKYHQVYNNKVTNEKFKHLIHYHHESIRSIRHFKWYYKPSIQPLLVLKAAFHSPPSLLLIWWYSFSQINARKHIRTM